MSSHASRVWMTSGRSRSWASAIWAANAARCDLAGRVVVVVVEPALPDRHDRAGRRAGDDGVDALAGVVGVQPDRGPHVVVGGGDGERLERRGRSQPTVIIASRRRPRPRRQLGGRLAPGRWQC